MPVRTGQGLRPAGMGRRLPLWLLAISLAFGLILGQFAEAGTLAEHHVEATLPGLDASVSHGGNQVSPVPDCHPGIACAAFVVPAGPSPVRSGFIVSLLRPDVARSQLRFGGPTVTLPPPRTLI